MKMYNIKGLDVFITKSKYNGSYFVRCSNGYTRMFMDYSIKEILEIIEQDNFPIIDFEEDSSTPFDSEWVEVEAEDEREALKIATELGYTMPNGFVSNSLTVEVQL